MLGIIYLGVKSEWDDRHDAVASSQLVKQDGQEKAYSAAPFEPYVESPGGTGPFALPTGPVNPQVSHGRGIFEAHGEAQRLQWTRPGDYAVNTRGRRHHASCDVAPPCFHRYPHRIAVASCTRPGEEMRSE